MGDPDHALIGRRWWPEDGLPREPIGKSVHRKKRVRDRVINMGAVMFTQLSLFDHAIGNDTVHATERSVVLPGQVCASPRTRQPEPQRAAGSEVAVELTRQIEVLERRSPDRLQPMGDLARLVLARYDLLASRRRELERVRREQPRRSIRVMAPIAG